MRTRTPASCSSAAWATIESSFWAARSSTRAVARDVRTASIDGRRPGPAAAAASGESTQASTAGRSGWASSSSPRWMPSSRPATATTRSRWPSRVGAVPGQGATGGPGTGTSRAVVPRTTNRGRRGAPSDELEDGDAERGHRGRAERRRERRPAGAGQVGQAGAVGGDHQQAHVGQRPGEAEGGGVVVAVGGGVGLAQAEDDADRPQDQQRTGQAAHACTVSTGCRLAG